MRKVRTTVIAIITGIMLLGTIPALAGDTWVRGYTRKDGTYVAPHYRSAPDQSYNNNWSTDPNINPYTGKRGTRTPTWNDGTPAQGNDLYNSGVGRPSSPQWDMR